MSIAVTIGLILGFVFILIYLIINRDDPGHIDDPGHLFDLIYRSFIYSAGIIMGLCTVYYAITGNYPLDLTSDNIRLPISIGGAMLLLGSGRAQWRLIFHENQR